VGATKKSFQYGDHTVTIETGELARQADGAVLVTMSDTVVLVTAVGLKKATPARLLSADVNYQEKTYAAGRIPGGFFKREGRPTEKETLTSRLIDRPIRPLFPEGFINDVQVVASVLSVNSEVDPTSLRCWALPPRWRSPACPSWAPSAPRASGIWTANTF